MTLALYPRRKSQLTFCFCQAIVEGEPPDLPTEGFSNAAREFVKGCLNKVPKARPTYAMLLQHPWLKSLSKPHTITEEVEEGDAAEEVADAVGKIVLDSGTEDAELAKWVNAVLRQKNGEYDAAGPSKPALHAAPLDGLSPSG